MAGIGPITWADLVNFGKVTGIRLAPWEIQLIEDIDQMYRVKMMAKAPTPSPVPA